MENFDNKLNKIYQIQPIITPIIDLSPQNSKSSFRDNFPETKSSEDGSSSKSYGIIRGNVPYMKIYFDFGFYFCITPFRFIRKDSLSGNKYVLSKNRLQRVFCAISHFLALWTRLAILREQPIRSSSSPRVFYYFDILQAISIAAYFLVHMITLWRLDTKIEELMSVTLKYSQFQFDKHKKLNKATFLCLIAATISIVSPFVGYDVTSSTETEKSVSYIVQSFLQQGKFALFLDQNPTLNYTNYLANNASLDQMSATDSIIIGFEFMAKSSSQTFDFFASRCLLLLPLVLLEATLTFKKGFNSYEVHVKSFDKILDQFHMLKELSEAINEFIGPTLFVYIIVSLLYFAVNLDELLVEPDWYRKFVVVYFLLNDISILFVSGQVCQEINTFKTWLLQREHRGILSSNEMTLLLLDVSSNPVAISGNGKFIIDNSFIGSVGVTLITLFVIVLQFKPNP